MTWQRQGDVLELDVIDDGPGLAATANLFTPFFTTKRNGTGIGLVLSRQIAEGAWGDAFPGESHRRAGVRGEAADSTQGLNHNFEYFLPSHCHTEYSVLSTEVPRPTGGPHECADAAG